MTIGSVGSTSIQTLRNQLMQQLNATGSPSQDATGSASPLGDLLTLSPAAQQLAQAPAAVTQAMTDILAGKKAAQEDLAQLKTFLQNNPGSLDGLLSSVQGSLGTQGATSDTLLTGFLNQQSNASNPAALLRLLASPADSGSGATGTLSALFG